MEAGSDEESKKQKDKGGVNRMLKFFIKFKLHQKQYEIDFKYDMDRDNPALIAQEMKEMLGLPQPKIDAIRKQLEALVAKNQKTTALQDTSQS